MLPPRGTVLGIIAAAVATRRSSVALAFSPLKGFYHTGRRSITSSLSTTTSRRPAASANEICETAITPQGKAQILCTISDNEDDDDRRGEPSSLWSDVAIRAARQFTVTQRTKLEESGAMDVERPVRITGEPLANDRGLGARAIDRDGDGANPPASDPPSNVAVKVIHFQRHGQGYHNLVCDMWRELGQPIDFDSPDPNLNPVVRPEFLDPPLTALGVRQCAGQRGLCATLSPELVVVSPMLRCLQTAKLSFRDHVGSVPWVSHEGCREELGLLAGNRRRSIGDIRVDYPEIDFSDIRHDEDVLWEEYGDRRETLLEKSERIYEFLTEYVRRRPEREIAIVCHSAYLFTLLNAVVDVDDEELKSWFLTSEVRSLQMTFSERESE